MTRSTRSAAPKKTRRAKVAPVQPSARPDGGPMLAPDAPKNAPTTMRSPESVVQPSAPVSGVYKVGGRDASPYQGAIFADVASGTGHTVVRARAGTGKTSTIVAALSYVPKGLTVLFCAFNKSIATELQSRAPAGVEVSTLHSLGFACIRNAFRGVRVDNRKLDNIVQARLGSARETIEIRNLVSKAVAFAKGNLCSDPRDLATMIDGMVASGQAEWPNDKALTMDRVVADICWILGQCKAQTSVIDFDDMVWFPIVHDLSVWQRDRVFVDETQDLNKCQIALALKACKPTGRICAVGDDRQAIYAFRGADARALDNVVDALVAKVLPLSITYRCASKIVDLAKQIVPDYEAAPGAPEGEIVTMSVETLKAQAKPGDFVISRANAPLVGLCLAFLRAGTPARVQGRDIGANLIALVRKSGASSIGDLTAWIDQWAADEVQRLTRRIPPPEAAIEAVYDKAECIQALCEGAPSVDALLAKIEVMFADSDDARMVVLGTTHKLKGLERERAFVLSWTYKAGRSVEEANLWYVAVTRAKSYLGIVTK